MATDTARVELELASGKNEVTAPFHQTVQRRRRHNEQDAISVDAPESPPASTQSVIPAPLANASPLSEVAALPREPAAEPQPTGIARPTWIAFIAAMITVGVGVWWVMSQRMPDIDPREVIARNLNDAQTAMADGRYTDPPQRSALHYYSTVLALDPSNAAALAGVDAIADRHLTDARILLARQKIAEAGVALEKARRVRPEHEGLASLDAQWRRELRTILAASTKVAKPTPEPKSTVAKWREALQRSIGADSTKAEERTADATSSLESQAPQAAGSAPDIQSPLLAPTSTTEPGDATAALAATETSPTPLAAMVAEPAPPAAAGGTELSASTNDIESNAAASAPPETPGTSEPKLIKMVQPVYPQEALMRGIEGWVDVSLQVSSSGDVIAPRIEESSRGRMFHRAALSAVEQWKYEPRSDGTTSERVHVRVQFKQTNP